MTITPDVRARLRALADAATPGPWEADLSDPSPAWAAVTTPDRCIAEHLTREDAQLVAAARAAVPALLDALDAAEAERDHARSIAVSAGAAAQQTITELEAERDHLDAQLSSNSLALLYATLTIERVRAALDKQDRIHHGDPDDDCPGCAIDAIRTALDQEDDA